MSRETQIEVLRKYLVYVVTYM